MTSSKQDYFLSGTDKVITSCIHTIFPIFQTNKEQYLQLVTQWRMTRGIEEQTSAFLDGFNEVKFVTRFYNYL